MRTTTRSPAELLDSAPPHDVDAERQVLGAILLRPEAIDELDAAFRADAFYLDSHRKIFDTLVGLHERREPIDVASVVNRLKVAGHWETVGGDVGFLAIVESVAVSQHAAYHASVVARYARYRSMIHTGLDLIRDAYAASDSPDEIASRAEASLSEIDTAEYDGEPMNAADCAREVTAYIERVRERGTSAGVMIGLERFDKDHGGLFPGELNILAARPRIGKTALACQIARHVADRGKLVHFVSLEMRRVDLVSRMLCSASGVNGKRIRTANLTDADMSALAAACNDYARGNLRVQQRPTMDVFQIRRSARRLKKDGLAIIIVDYLQNVEPSKNHARSQRYVQVGQVAKDLHKLAVELDVPVLALCQVGRDIEKARRGKDGDNKPMPRPTLADLRESGDIEAAADVVVFLHRQAAGWARSEEDDTAELLLDKNRNGTTCGYKLRWNGPRTRFEEVEPENHDHSLDAYDGRPRDEF